MSPGLRLDLALLARKLASSRSKAQELIRSGKVLVDGVAQTKPGLLVRDQQELRCLEPEHRFVSRAGLKLEAGLRAFGLDPAGLRVLDVGQSTGGFTQCLLESGAAEVLGVEVGHGQLAEVLRADPRVRSLERTDIRSLRPEHAGAPFPFFVADLSFISLRLLIPVLPPLLAANAQGVVLVKPQFELEPGAIGSGGIVRDAADRLRALEQVRAACRSGGFTVAGELLSPLPGGDGNQETLFHLRRASPDVVN